MRNRPFVLPMIKTFEADETKTELVIEKIKSAKAFMTFIKCSPTEYQFYFSAFGEEELAMLLIIMDQQTPVFDFFKAAVVNTELYRLNELEGFNYTASLLEYIKKSKVI